MTVLSDCKTLSTSTCAGCIWILKIKSIAIKSAAKVKSGIAQVEEAAQIGYDLDIIIFEDLIIIFAFIIKVHVVSQARATSACHRDTNKIVFAQIFLWAKLYYFLFRIIWYK